MTDQFYPESQLPIRTTVDLLPGVFKTDTNSKFMSAVVDPLVQPGLLQKAVGYIGKRYGKTYNGSDTYLDSDNTLRSRYQLEPGVVLTNGDKIENFHDYIDLKNQLKFFGNAIERDDLVMSQEHYSWNPPINWDKFINYREYFWEPAGPLAVPVNGRGATVVSEYNVTAGADSFVFSPSSMVIDVKNNPTITLYRGQTYKFNVSTPNDSFIIRTQYDTGSMLYNPVLAYEQNQLAVYENQLIRAKIRIISSGTRTEPDLINDWEFVRFMYQTAMNDYVAGNAYGIGDTVVYSNSLWEATNDISTSEISIPVTGSTDWRFVGYVLKAATLEYSTGVVNNGTSSGIVVFEVSYDAPDVLFYQSPLDPNKFGKFIIESISENTTLDVDAEIVGLKNYTSNNGVVFTNGLVIEFRGTVKPEKYSHDTWLVSGVGSSISLLKFSDLITAKVSTVVPDVLFDNEGFDTQPFDNAAAYPNVQDYITISQSSIDSNSWSRYNRWFHRSVLEYSCALRGQEYSAPESYRAKRPIIEFVSNLKLHNHGSTAKKPVDFVDTSTTDVFSIIEGSAGYQIDNEVLFNGARILVTADTDNLVNNKIYEVQLLTFNHNTQIVTDTTSTIIPQIHLVEVDDSLPYVDQCVLIKHGKRYGGSMFHFNGTNWVLSQEKTAVNQAPLFDVYDENEISFSNTEYYPVSTFAGSKILSYKVGNGRLDTQLGFSLSYLNIGNVGDIQFDWNFGTDAFTYDVNRDVISKKIETGYYKITNVGLEYGNGWIKTKDTYIQPIIDSQKIKEPTYDLTFTSIDFASVPVADMIIRLFVNGKSYNGDYLREGDVFTFPVQFAVGDVVSIKIISKVDPKTGYYEIPVGLEKNPLNQVLESFTLGQADDHINTAVEFFTGFTGTIPGVSNLRDLDEYQPYATRFLKHSGIAPLASYLLCDKTYNIVKSLQYAKKMYTEFKNNFIERASYVSTSNAIDAVDSIVTSLASTKTVDSAFAYSDMIGSGAYTPIRYTVEDTGIKTYALSKKFNLTELSNSAVYVYIHRIGSNGFTVNQLINTVDYKFNDVFGYITLLIELFEGDVVEIREYLSTAVNYIPATPTSIGLHKKYTPMKFLDDTYAIPRMVIQGHDGSITAAYEDYRDDILLELELRIYNNIKQEYDTNIFDIDEVLGGYYNTGLYTKDELDLVIKPEFYKWNAQAQLNYTENSWFDETNTFTYNYSRMTDPLNSTELPGYWRGVYQWFYDTDRPHRCPWEMLGFSEKPEWWESEYGPAPYTSDNLLLWEDLRDGIIRQGSSSGYNARYKRPTLLEHIPVDSTGTLLSPLNSRLAHEFNIYTTRDSYVFGDVSPVEYAWRSSSDWPFVISIAMCLLKPFEYISDKIDVSRTRTNLIGQKVHDSSGVFATLSDLVLPSNDNQSCGLITYLVDHAKSKVIDPAIIGVNINNLDVKLSTRLSGFVVTDQQKYILDSKTGNTTGGVFVPPENYDIIFNVSSPIRTLTYSGVIITKSDMGWVVSGYNTNHQYFNYYEALASSKDPYLTITPQNTDQIISVGGVSASYTDWEPNIVYANGQIVRYDQHFYRALKTNSSTTFNDEHNYWKLLSNLPITGEVVARNRKSFNRFTVKTMLYGTTLSSIQEVVDFLLGYEVYLKSIGFVFDGYDSDSRVAINWSTSCKEFMFWTKHNWATGSLISLSPISSRIEINMNGGVVENLTDGFYDYEVLKSNGQVFPIDKLSVTRTFQKIVITPDSKTDGIYYLNMYCVLKEHVTVFSDRTVFNDVIYDKTTGYRQNRIKSTGYRTVDWDGDYTSPGFLFDNVSIVAWQPYADYKLGDIVAYRSTNWTCIKHHTSTSIFDNAVWTKLDSTPTKQLVSNFDYKINQFDEFYDTSAEGIGASQRELARHAIGYQTREYLQELAEDPVTQFQLYQGFIREKGTINAVNKVIDKLSRSGDSSIVLNEEWAFRVGQFGGVDTVTEFEFGIEKNKLVLNPQPITITNDTTASDYEYRINESNFTLAPSNVYAGINKMSYDVEPTRTAGYVKSDHVSHTVKTFDDILSLDITSMVDNDHIWVTFYQYTWNVYRFNDTNLRVLDVVQSDNTVNFVLSSRHGFKVGDIFGVRPLGSSSAFSGFFKVVNTSWNSVSVDSADVLVIPTLSVNKPIYACTIKQSRYKSYSAIDDVYAAGLSDGSRLWIDLNDNKQWEVIQKKDQFITHNPVNYGPVAPVGVGRTVIYADKLKNVITSVPGSDRIVVHSYGSAGLTYEQSIVLPAELTERLNGSFGYSMAVSPDNRFLVVGSPLASNVPSKYKGEYDETSIYIVGELVTYNGKLWELSFDQILPEYVSMVDDGELIGQLGTNTMESGMWTVATNNFVASAAVYNSDYIDQGMVSIYEYTENDWKYITSFVSQDLDHTTKFGESVAIGAIQDGYLLAISAVIQADDSTQSSKRGVVYTYQYINSSWSIQTDYTSPDNNTQPDTFGRTLAISADSSVLVIGDPTANNTVSCGAVYVYDMVNVSVDAIWAPDSVSGDNFGYAIALDSTGSTLVVTSPNADSTIIDQGKAYVFTKTGSNFELSQTIESFEYVTNEQFGSSVSIYGSKLVVGARNSNYVTYDGFDVSFDGNRTKFYSDHGYAGAVYVFEYKGDGYLLTSELKPLLKPYESFGFSIACTSNAIFVGSPTYTLDENIPATGMLRGFVETAITGAWDVIAKQSSVVDTSNIKGISLYDNVNSLKIQDIDYVDNSKLKILNFADQEITYKTLYDPAVYTIGTNDEIQIIEPTQAWADKFVGMLWWDISKSKWNYAEQGDLSYRVGHWNTQVVGSSVEVYEWVKTTLLPSEWADVADTNEGISAGISGQPMYPDDTVMSVKELYHPITGVVTDTYYYYWVKNKSNVPENVVGRRISALNVSTAISNPIGTGVAFVGLCDDNSVLAYNFSSILTTETALLNLSYFKNTDKQIPIHNEYQLLSAGNDISDISTQLEAKWIDSLIGRDIAGNRVPDDTLPTKLKYGIGFRPRQSMFIDRLNVLNTVITNTNTILASKPFTSTLDFTNLKLVDLAPSMQLNQYDTVVDTIADLQNVKITRFMQASLSLELTNGKVTAVNIVNQGYGYKPSIPVYTDISVTEYNYQGIGYKGPLVTVSGDGTGAVIEVIIDKNGQVILANIVNSGKKYSIANAVVRPYAVLVNSDSTVNGYWSIYSWDYRGKQFNRSTSQAFDTTKYWTYVDWWDIEHGTFSTIAHEVPSMVYINSVTPEIGQLVRIKEYESGGWAVFECTKIPSDAGIFSDFYKMVGRESGTIALSTKLYDQNQLGNGYDSVTSFDSNTYDMDCSLELRNILRAIKVDICKDDNTTEWGNLFFTCIREVFAEQMYVDWAFKTSFLTAIHNIGPFKQPTNYKNDNLHSFQSYIDEVKPYRSTIREYISRYNTIENTPVAISDFDLPATFMDGMIKPVTVKNWYQINKYPWNWWVNNHTYSLTAIVVNDGGEDYIQPPEVVITGTGVNATARAYIFNGSVTTVVVDNNGYGFLSAPSIELIGGNTPGSRKATAIAVIGDSKARQFGISLKFDRLSKTGLYADFTNEETFIATGFTSVFKLLYIPVNDKSKIRVTINGKLLLNNDYAIELTIPEGNKNNPTGGTLIIENNPVDGDVITISYEKHDSLLDSVNRIDKYYQPIHGMKGNQLTQLITGVDFGGIQVQGTTFDATGGWDSQDWFTDNWDSVERSNDYYYVSGGPTPTISNPYVPVSTVTLPYIPTNGQHINIYVKRESWNTISQYALKSSPFETINGSIPEIVRLDDVAYTDNWDSSSSINPYAQMPTFIGNGVTATIDIGSYFKTEYGDTLIFRPEDSDGSLVVNDPNILDTNLSGGSLERLNSAYTTATGLSAADIIIEGGQFISPAHVSATEENVPGQVLDGLSIKVFDTIFTGTTPLHSTVVFGDGVTKTYDIGLSIIELTSVIVMVDKVKLTIDTQYSINLTQNTVTLVTPAAIGSTIEITAIGVGGVSILDSKEFIADGKATKFTTAAKFKDTSAVYVTVNGVHTPVGFGSSTTKRTTGKTVITINPTPAVTAVIKVVCFGNMTTSEFDNPIAKINQNKFIYTDTNEFTLQLFSTEPSTYQYTPLLVDVNGVLLTGVDTTYGVYDGNTNSFKIERGTGYPTPNNVKVYVNNQLKDFLIDYTFNESLTVVTIDDLSIGDTIIIENNSIADYTVHGNLLSINDGILSTGDVINAVWFTQYQAMKLITDEHVGGKSSYLLAIKPIDTSYVWVYVNGNKLTPTVDYYLSDDRTRVYLNKQTIATDTVKVVVFGAKICTTKAYEISKDMLNVYRYNRYSANSVKLAGDLNYYDTELSVTDSTDLYVPNPVRNKPGIVSINGERIEYFEMTGNVLSKLRRGCYGTAIATIHQADSYVVNVSDSERVPYNETEYKETVSIPDNDSSLEVGPLSFTPIKSTRTNWAPGQFPEHYGPCDQIEVFFNGKRLRKNPIMVYNEVNGISSPVADVMEDAEFAVNGTDDYILLSRSVTENIPADTIVNIAVYRRVGKVWYEQSLSTASTGITLLDNNTPMAKFISEKTTVVSG